MTRPSLEHSAIATLVAASSAILLTHGLVAFLRPAFVEPGAIPAGSLSILAIAAALMAAPGWTRFEERAFHLFAGLGVGLLAMLAAWFPLGAGARVSLALVVAAPIASVARTVDCDRARRGADCSERPR